MSNCDFVLSVVVSLLHYNIFCSCWALCHVLSVYRVNTDRIGWQVL